MVQKHQKHRYSRKSQFRKNRLKKNKIITLSYHILFFPGVASIINKLKATHFDENDEQLFEVI